MFGGNAGITQVLMKFMGDASGAISAIKQTDSSMTGLSGAMERHKRSINLAMTAIAGAVAGIGIASIKSASEFESAMTNVSTLGDIGADTMKMMEDAILGFDAGMGGASENAKALYQIISAGAKPGAEAIELLEISAKGAQAGLTETETAADALTTALATFGDQGYSASEIMDGMFKTVQQGKINFDQLSSEIGKASSQVATAGFTFDDFGAAIAQLTAETGLVSESMTNLRGLANSIIGPTKDAAKAAKKYGVDLRAVAEGTMSAEEWLKHLYERIGDNEQALKEIFPNQEAFNAVLVLMKNNAEGFSDKLGGMADKIGETDRAFSKQQETFESAWKRMGVVFDKLLIQIGQKLVPAVQDVVEGIEDFTQKLINAEDEFPRFWQALERTGEFFLKLATEWIPAAIEAIANLRDEMRGFSDEGQNWADDLQIVRKAFLDLYDGTAPVEEIFNRLPESVRRYIAANKTMGDDIRLMIGTLDEETLILNLLRDWMNEAERATEKMGDTSKKASKETDGLANSLGKAGDKFNKGGKSGGGLIGDTEEWDHTLNDLFVHNLPIYTMLGMAEWSKYSLWMQETTGEAIQEIDQRTYDLLMLRIPGYMGGMFLEHQQWTNSIRNDFQRMNNANERSSEKFFDDLFGLMTGFKNKHWTEWLGDLVDLFGHASPDGAIGKMATNYDGFLNHMSRSGSTWLGSENGLKGFLDNFKKAFGDMLKDLAGTFDNWLKGLGSSLASFMSTMGEFFSWLGFISWLMGFSYGGPGSRGPGSFEPWDYEGGYGTGKPGGTQRGGWGGGRSWESGLPGDPTGFQGGGPIPEYIRGIGMSGRRYEFHGPGETVVPNKFLGGITVNINYPMLLNRGAISQVTNAVQRELTNNLANMGLVNFSGTS